MVEKLLCIVISFIFVLGCFAQNKYFIQIQYHDYHPNLNIIPKTIYVEGLTNYGENKHLITIASFNDTLFIGGHFNNQIFLREDKNIDLIFDDVQFGIAAGFTGFAKKDNNNFICAGLGAVDNWYVDYPTFNNYLGFKNGTYSQYDFSYQIDHYGFIVTASYNKNYYYIMGANTYEGFDNDDQTSNIYFSLLKIDTNHNIVFDTIYEVFEDPECNTFVDFSSNIIYESVPALNNQGIYVLADFIQLPSKLLIAEIDEQGNFLWQTILDENCDLQYGNIYATHQNIFATAFEVNFPMWEDDVHHIYKFDLEGNIIFDLSSETSFAQATSIIANKKDEIIIAGRHLYSTQYTFSCIQKLDSLGNILWTRNLDIFDELENGIQFRPEIIFERDDSTGLNGYILAVASLYNENDNFYFLKLNCMGLPLDPISKFTTQTNNNEVTFFNQSLNIFADSIDGGYYVFNFGDGDSLLIESDSINTFTHNFVEPNYYQTTLNSYLCIDTAVFTATVCPGMPLPNINLNFTVNLEPINDTMVLLQLQNNSSNLSQYFGNYYWSINNEIPILSNNNYFEIEHFKDSTLSITLQTSLICDSIFSETETIDLILSNSNNYNTITSNKIQLYPNPFDNYLTISNLQNQQNAQLKIYDAVGKLVLQQNKLNTNQNISTKQLLKGIYFYKITAETGVILSSGKLVK